MSNRAIGPTVGDGRIVNLDVLRGVATLGTFFMSAVAYGLPHAAFFNLKSPDTNRWFDWAVGAVGEIFFDQKVVALLALLYGAGVVRACLRIDELGGSVRWLILRRSLVLFLLGMPVGMHGLLWEGTTLWFFGFFTPLLALLRRRRIRTLVAIGSTGIVLSALAAFEFQPETSNEAEELGQYWVTGSHGGSDLVGAFVVFGTFFLLLGTMILGLAVGRAGLLDADPNGPAVARMVRYGLGVGVLLAAGTLVWRIAGDFEPSVAIVAEFPNTLAAAPVALGYVGLVTRWRASGSLSWLADRTRAVGQMALTNSVGQTLFGIFVLRDYGFGRGTFSRAELLVVVVAVWTLQLVVSKPWLDRFEHGPLEWGVRCVTYRRRLPLRLAPPVRFP